MSSSFIFRAQSCTVAPGSTSSTFVVMISLIFMALLLGSAASSRSAHACSAAHASFARARGRRLANCRRDGALIALHSAHFAQRSRFRAHASALRLRQRERAALLPLSAERARPNPLGAAAPRDALVSAAHSQSICHATLQCFCLLLCDFRLRKLCLGEPAFPGCAELAERECRERKPEIAEREIGVAFQEQE